jgi:hypothetical protein
LVPKGRHDCGAHAWYRADEETDHCYHCEVGVRRHVLHPLDLPEFEMLISGVENGSETSAAILLRRLHESETSLLALGRQAAERLRGSGLLEETDLAYVERLGSPR